MIEPADPNDPPKLVAAGKLDLAISYQPQLHIQVDQGLPLVRVGTLVSVPLNSLVVLKDGPIKSIADLKGKKVGFSVGGFEEALLSGMLQKNNLKMSDVQLININFSLSPSLIAKKVDNLNKEKLRCWRLPLYQPYLKKIKSQVAELSNASLDGMAGSITAALFLKEFLNKSDTPWLHFDTYAWSQGSILGSNGAALQGLEIMSEFLRKNFN